jgi:pimeloyl-ACP methyl ester carboxylesterase
MVSIQTSVVRSFACPPVLRAPNGVVEDGLKYWGNGVIPWKPEDIKVPVLLIKAEWDQDTPAYMAQNLFPKLTGAPYKRYVEIGEGTHTVITEKNRLNLFREVQLFLDEQHSAAKEQVSATRAQPLSPFRHQFRR